MSDNQIAVRPERAENLPAVVGVYNSIQSFEDAQRMAKALAASSLVPQEYQGNTANTMIALEMAQRTGSSPMAVMQNLHIIQGRPSWSSQFTIAALNSCGRFSPLRFKVRDIGKCTVKYEEWTGPKGQRSKVQRSIEIQDSECVAWAYDKATGEVLEGPRVSITMAVLEGWYTKSDSKWVTMPELMLRYRSAKFFGNLYAPDVLMGMHTQDEVEDFIDVTPRADRPAAAPIAANDNQPRAASAVNDLNSFAAAQPAVDSLVINAEAVTVEGELITREQTQPEPEQKPAAGRRQRRAPAAAEAATPETVEEPKQPEEPAQTTQAADTGKDLF